MNKKVTGTLIRTRVYKYLERLVTELPFEPPSFVLYSGGFHKRKYFEPHGLPSF
jgi:hypothetical protein